MSRINNCQRTADLAGRASVATAPWPASINWYPSRMPWVDSSIFNLILLLSFKPEQILRWRWYHCGSIDKWKWRNSFNPIHSLYTLYFLVYSSYQDVVSTIDIHPNYEQPRPCYPTRSYNKNNNTTSCTPRAPPMFHTPSWYLPTYPRRFSYQPTASFPWFGSPAAIFTQDTWNPYCNITCTLSGSY